MFISEHSVEQWFISSAVMTNWINIKMNKFTVN